MDLLSGGEPFTNRGEPQDFTVLDYWSYRFSNIARDPEYVAEFLVARALGKDKPIDMEGWTLWDIEYEGRRIEVKETSYWHPFNGDGHASRRRSFGITKAKGEGDIPVRQNDVYVFCLLTGDNDTDACPLDVSHWEFYVVPTAVINEKCGDQKSVSLSRVQDMAGGSVDYWHLRDAVDAVIKSL